MTPEQKKTVLLFFHLALVNPKWAEEASRLLIKFDRKQRSGGKAVSFELNLVRQGWQIYKEVRQKMEKSSGFSNELVGLPREFASFDTGPWKDFLQSAPPAEALILIWRHILGIPLEIIALGLGVTEGTLRYRLSRATERLGGKLEEARVLVNP